MTGELFVDWQVKVKVKYVKSVQRVSEKRNLELHAAHAAAVATA